MIKVLVKDVLNACRQHSEHLYIYYNRREVKLFKKRSTEKLFKKIPALTILRSLKIQEPPLLSSLSEAAGLRTFAHGAMAKEQHRSGFMHFLSKLHNAIGFKEFLTSRKLAGKLFHTLTDKGSSQNLASPEAKAQTAPPETASTSKVQPVLSFHNPYLKLRAASLFRILLIILQQVSLGLSNLSWKHCLLNLHGGGPFCREEIRRDLAASFANFYPRKHYRVF